MCRNRHDVGVGALHFANLRGKARIGEQPFALPQNFVAALGSDIFHRVVRCVAVGEIFFDAAPESLNVRVAGLDPFE